MPAWHLAVLIGVAWLFAVSGSLALAQETTTSSTLPSTTSEPTPTSSSSTTAAGSTTTTTTLPNLTPLCEYVTRPAITENSGWHSGGEWINSWPVHFGGAEVEVTSGATVVVDFEFGDGGVPYEAMMSVQLDDDPQVNEWLRFDIDPPGDGRLSWTFDGSETGMAYQMVDKGDVEGTVTISCYLAGETIPPPTTTLAAPPTEPPPTSPSTTVGSSDTLPDTGSREDQLGMLAGLALGLVTVGLALLTVTFLAAQRRTPD